MAKWQASKGDVSPRKGYIPEAELDTECNCECGCTNPLDWGTCVDCGDGDHQNNNELEKYKGE